MNIIKPLLIAGSISITLNSCFLFRSKHQSCPAYGENMNQHKDSNTDLKIEKVETTQQA